MRLSAAVLGILCCLAPTAGMKAVTPATGMETESASAFVRRVVVEEGTGTWCRYCPRGIVGMKMMAEKYPDRFIGIAVHSGEDPMAIADYRPLQNAFPTLPMCKADRNTLGDPYEDIERMVTAELEQTCNVDYYIDVSLSGDAVTAYSSVTVREPFAATSLNFAYVVVEDNVCMPGDRSYYQKNIYSGKDQEMGGWEMLPEEVSDYAFMDVARGIGGGYDGLPLLESDLLAGESAQFMYRFLLPDNILDRNNVSIVGLVIDAATGHILNACKRPLLKPSGADNIAAGAGVGPVSTAYYTVDGRAVNADALRSGLYVRVTVYADGTRSVVKEIH